MLFGFLDVYVDGGGVERGQGQEPGLNVHCPSSPSSHNALILSPVCKEPSRLQVLFSSSAFKNNGPSLLSEGAEEGFLSCSGKPKWFSLSQGGNVAKILFVGFI